MSAEQHPVRHLTHAAVQYRILRMLSRISAILRKTPARYLYHRVKALRGGSSQSDEARILVDLSRACPKTFVEFGFHPTEYNCIGLAEFAGLLIDGDSATTKLARAVLPKRIKVRNQFLTLDNLDSVARFHAELGVLSIDVDGNDYWFLEYLLATRPHVISVEYNASLLVAPLTVPYDPHFDRHQKHASGWYHGASLPALARLCSKHDYKLVAVAAAGANAFFVRRDSAMQALDPVAAYRENLLRNQWSRTTARDQWERISGLPFVEV
jgi:hypothetical protein